MLVNKVAPESALTLLLPGTDTTRSLRPERGPWPNPASTLISAPSLQTCEDYISTVYDTQSMVTVA